MPTLGSVPGIDSYAVTAADETRYYVDVSFAGNLYGWGCSGFFGGGFGCGWGGFGGWWGGWGGYFGGWGFGGWGFGGLSGYYGYGDWDPITGWSGYNSGTSTNLLSWAGYDDLAVGYFGGFGDPSLPEPKPPLPLEAGYWDLAGEINDVRYAASYSAAADPVYPTALVTSEAFTKAQESGGLQVSAIGPSAPSEPHLDRFDMLQFLSGRAPEVSAFIGPRVRLNTKPVPDRPSPPDLSQSEVPLPTEARAAEPPIDSLAAEKITLVLPAGMAVFAAADEVQAQILPPKQPAAPQGQAPTETTPPNPQAEKIRPKFEKHTDARKTGPKNLRDQSRRAADTNGGDDESVERIRADLKRFVEEKFTKGMSPQELEQFYKGFLEGFVDGFMDYIRMLQYFAQLYDDAVLVSPAGRFDIPHSDNLAQQAFTLAAWVRPYGPGPNDDEFGSIIIAKGIGKPQPQCSCSRPIRDRPDTGSHPAEGLRPQLAQGSAGGGCASLGVTLRLEGAGRNPASGKWISTSATIRDSAGATVDAPLVLALISSSSVRKPRSTRGFCTSCGCWMVPSRFQCGRGAGYHGVWMPFAAAARVSKPGKGCGQGDSPGRERAPCLAGSESR